VPYPEASGGSLYLASGVRQRFHGPFLLHRHLPRCRRGSRLASGEPWPCVGRVART
jgi:hypothetical protein